MPGCFLWERRPRREFFRFLAHQAKSLLKNRSITADTALRLARFFGTTHKLWLNLQVSFDLDSEEDRLGGKIRQEVKPVRDVA
jgi:plasmid maintenance system antidote protein VapI